MKLAKIILSALLLMPACFYAMEPSSKNDPSGLEPMSVLAEKIACQRLYRVRLPLKSANRELAVVFGLPSDETAKKSGTVDALSFITKNSRFMFTIVENGRALETGNIPVNPALFEEILTVISKSEVFSLAGAQLQSEPPMHLVLLDGGYVTAERLSDQLKTVKRVYNESVPATYLADELRRIVVAHAGRDLKLDELSTASP
jgi:hypothetical protein